MPIEAYDAFDPPDPLEWLALGEQERVDMVLAYHHGIGDKGENEQIHCLLHVIVENQIAMGSRMPTGGKIRQLMAQGLDRHQALHAIAILVARHMHRLSRQMGDPEMLERRYHSEVARMTARKFMGMTR